MLLVWFLAAVALAAPAAPATPQPVDVTAQLGLGPVVYQRPVPGELVSGFEQPIGPFGPGHRGVDLRVGPREPVVAAANGVVTFAGTVAGRAWVTLQHADGIRTTYGALTDLRVRRGEVVVRGQLLGDAAGDTHDRLAVPVLHWGARYAHAYLDPLSLVDRGPWRPALVGPGGWDATHLPDLHRYASWDGQHRFGFVPGSSHAEHAGWAHAPNPNHVIGVAGLGSNSMSQPIDLEHLGFSTEDVTYLSYSGRHDEAGDATDPRRDQLTYGAEDTWEGVWQGAFALRDQLRAQWQRSPGQGVDLVGHSMGGVVIMTYVLFLHDPTDPTLPPLGHVATIASPLQGADIAWAVKKGMDDPLGRRILEGVAEHAGQDPSSQAIRDLAVGSDVVEGIDDRWADATADVYAGPLATGTKVFTFGGSKDLIVPEHRSELPGADHVVLPGSHDGVRETEASRIALRAFLADQPVPGEDGGVGHWVSHPLSWAERGIGLLLDVDPLAPFGE